MERILIVGAHFDDAELGVGGTAAKLAKEGKAVYKLTLTDNVTDSDVLDIHVKYEDSKSSSAKACNILGVKEIDTFNGVQCTKLTYNTEIMQCVERYIYDLDIDTLFLHFGTDMNTDHVEASKICITAGRHCKNILQFQSNGYVLENVYYPTFFVDISSSIDMKRDALKCYGEEHNRFNRLFESCIERNHLWGFSNKCEYAEGFNVIKMLHT